MSMNKRITWHTETRDIEALTPYAKNRRRINEQTALELRKSIEKFNVAAIPAVQPDGTILSGHQRITQAKKLGRKTIEVRVPSRPLTADEARRFTLWVNAARGEWDYSLLATHNEVDDLLAWGFTRSQLGLDVPMLADLSGESPESVKQIVLIYEPDEFDALVVKLNELREGKYDGASFSDIIISLLNTAYYGLERS